MSPDEKQICEIKGCDNEVARSIATKNIIKNLPELKVDDEKKKRTHICKDHYKAFKKATKEERELDRLGR
jgi:hypothetical protein